VFEHKRGGMVGDKLEPLDNEKKMQVENGEKTKVGSTWR